jgi:hypothetical protein
MAASCTRGKFTDIPVADSEFDALLFEHFQL